MNTTNKKLEKLLLKYGKDTIAKMIIILRNGGKGDSRFINKMKAYVEESDDILQLFIEMPAYGTFIDKGRRPGAKMPPEKPIVEWMQRKSIIASPYIIRKNISVRGIKPLPFIDIWYKNILKLNDQLIDVTKETINEFIKELKNNMKK